MCLINMVGTSNFMKMQGFFTEYIKIKPLLTDYYTTPFIIIIFK